MIDLLIVLGYFLLIFAIALTGRTGEEATTEQYFLSNRNLRWPSIALSTIATNIQGFQFLGMMGSAYLYGLAQANLEINAVQGILLAAFVFVPLYLRERVMTITQFIQKRLGKAVGLAYSMANIGLFATVTLGMAFFWGAYAADLVFAEYLMFISEEPLIRMSVLIVGIGLFSATYTYLGGLSAVVKTDVIQFGILFLGGATVLFVALQELGGWSQLYEKTPDLMHLHLPAEHEKLPWTHLFGLFFLNINYWCANQTVMQRSLAAKSLREAQIGLMVGGVTKYAMAVLIVIPGIALVGIIGQSGLASPDEAFPYLVKTYLPTGIKGIILCGLFASLMSTVDSTFNSLATLFSIDIYQGFLRPQASEQEVVKTGRLTILVTFFTGVTMGLYLLQLKFSDPDAAFTHQLNEIRYYINCGIVVLICTAVLVLAPNKIGVLVAFLLTIPLNFVIKETLPELNYFVRAGIVIVVGLLTAILASGVAHRSLRIRWQGVLLGIGLGYGLWLLLPYLAPTLDTASMPGIAGTFALLMILTTSWRGFRPWRELVQYDSKEILYLGAALLASLVALHVVFH
ncbi:MAG: sodium/solute symporter [Bacteroidota bacterium]